MKQRKLLAILGVVVLTATVCAWAGDTVIDPAQKYLLLATSKTGTMQKELDDAASQGFRIVTGAGVAGSEIAIILERIPEGSEKYVYKLLATTKTSTMEKELNANAKEGFRLLPRTMTAKEGFMSKEIVVVLERDPNLKGQEFEYKLLATSLTGTLQKEMAAAAKEGYTIAAFASRGEHMVIMERAKK